jgi:hypothetical protein
MEAPCFLDCIEVFLLRETLLVDVKPPADFGFSIEVVEAS